MIVVEGADNVGKTTLVRALLELDPELHEIKRKRFHPDRSETIGTSYVECLLAEDRAHHGRGVADRLLASEYIYGQLFRGGSRVTPAERMAVQLLLISYGATVVHCDPPNSAILEAWGSREQLYDDPIRIADAYRRRMSAIFDPIPVTTFDWTVESPGELLEISCLEEERPPRLARWSQLPYGAGCLTPTYLLVGEAPSPRAVVPVPFASGPAGDFLAWSIESCGVSDALLDVYVTNASKGRPDDAEILAAEMKMLVGPRTVVIALGREAERALEPALIGCSPRALTRLPHPQFWRRFHWKRRHEYAAMLGREMMR